MKRFVLRLMGLRPRFLVMASALRMLSARRYVNRLPLMPAAAISARSKSFTPRTEREEAFDRVGVTWPRTYSSIV